MKKGRFLWSAHRITEKQKAGQARNIKEKQLKNSRNTVSKQLVALRSSASDNFCSQSDNRLGRENAYKTSETLCFWGFSLPSNLYGMSRNLVEICGYVASMQHVCIKTSLLNLFRSCLFGLCAICTYLCKDTLETTSLFPTINWNIGGGLNPKLL